MLPQRLAPLAQIEAQAPQVAADISAMAAAAANEAEFRRPVANLLEAIARDFDIPLLLRELDQRYRIADQAAACLHDPRDSDKVRHDLLTLVRQRLFAIALSYEDNNDAVTLAKDPAFKIMAGKALESDGDLASQAPLPGLRTGRTPKTCAASPIGSWSCTSRPIPAPGRSSSWTWTPPTTPLTGNSSSAFFTSTTTSTCAMRFASLTAGTAFPWPPCCAPATPTPQRGRWQHSRG